MYISMHKLRQYQRVFNHFDKDGDGKISPSELQLCVWEMGVELELEQVKAAMEMIDSDGDGFAELDDLVSFFEGGEEEERIKDLREAFGMYGMEGSGCITPSSLKNMLRKLGQSSSIDECKNMIEKFDLNRDGVLDFEEFRIMME